MLILFTAKKNNLVSYVIRKILNEPVSHCAIKMGRFVIHSNFRNGVHIEPFSLFQEKNDIIYGVKVFRIPKFDGFLHRNYGKSYDYLGFIFLSLRYLLPKFLTKKININHMSGAFMCHELVTELLIEEELTLLTPYKLYLKIKQEEK